MRKFRVRMLDQVSFGGAPHVVFILDLLTYGTNGKQSPERADMCEFMLDLKLQTLQPGDVGTGDHDALRRKGVFFRIWG